MSVESGTVTPGLFIFRDALGGVKALHFQFNPESLKRTRTASVKPSDAGVNYVTTLNPETTGSRFFVDASSWKIDFDLRLEASKPAHPEHKLGNDYQWDSFNSSLAGESSPVEQDGAKSVRRMITELESMIEPLTEQHSENEQENANAGRRQQPFPVELFLGPRAWFGYITSLTINETLFNLSLQPMRAEVSISMEIIQTDSAFEKRYVGGLVFGGAA